MYPYPLYTQNPVKKDDSEIKAGINTGLTATILLAVSGNILAVAMMFIFSFITVLKIGTSVSQHEIESLITSLFSTENIYGLTVSIFLYIFTMFLPFLLIIIVRKQKVKELVSFKKPTALQVSYGVFITLGLSVLAQYIVSIVLSFLKSLGIPPSFPDIGMNTSSPVTIGLYFFFISVMPAVFEEFAMRGVVLGSLKNSSKYFALFFSALMFSIMHGTVQQIPYAFILGLSIGYFVLKFNSVWIGFFIHFVNNLISCVYELLSDRYNENILIVINNMINGLLIILGVLFVLIYVVREKIPLDNSGNTHTFKECIGVMLRRPMFYIAIAVFAVLTYINGYMI